MRKEIKRAPITVKVPGRQRPFLEQIQAEEYRQSIGDTIRSLVDREMARRSFGNGGDDATR
jgi:hypothetical protein